MKQFLLSIFLLLSFLSYSQQKNIVDTANFFNKLSKKIIALKNTSEPYNESFPFSAISVIDKRYDTSSIGYMRIYRPVYENCKLVTANTLKNDLESLLNQLFPKKNAADKASLVIVVRKFWFYKKYNVENDRFLKGNIIAHYTFNLSFDCFSFTDGVYIPLTRKDTAVVMDDGFKESEKGTLIGASLRNVLTSLSLDSVVHSISNRKKFSYEQLNDYYDKNSQLPILNNTALKKGVYRNFEEFKQNAPSIVNFEVQKGKQTIIYLISGRDTIPTRELWGYCDGENIFIKMDANIFKLHRQDRSFAFMGDKKLNNQQREYKIPAGMFSRTTLWLPALATELAMSVPDRFQYELIPLQLDMESGKVY